MAKVLIGNFKGPQGGQGIPGPQGEQGDQGIRGSRWTEGTAITGTSTTPTVFSGTGISDALAEDMYLNTDTGNAYRCTTGGVATVAKWVYACNLKGIKGDTGAKGDPGTAGPKGEKGDTGEQGPKGDTPTVADNMTVAFTQASSRSNIATGEKLSVIMGKIKKFFADLTAPAFAQMITTKEDLLATKVTGYVPDAKAVADTYTELNGKLSINRIERITDNKLHNINFKNYAKITAVAIIKPQENMYLSYSFDIPTETLSAAYGYWTQGHYKTSSDTSSCVLYMNQSNIRFVDAYYCGNSVKLDYLEIYAAK